VVTVSYYYTCHEQRNRAWLRSEALLFFMPSKRNKAAWRSLSALSTAQVDKIQRIKDGNLCSNGVRFKEGRYFHVKTDYTVF